MNVNGREISRMEYIKMVIKNPDKRTVKKLAEFTAKELSEMGIKKPTEVTPSQMELMFNPYSYIDRIHKQFLNGEFLSDKEENVIYGEFENNKEDYTPGEHEGFTDLDRGCLAGIY